MSRVASPSWLRPSPVRGLAAVAIGAALLAITGCSGETETSAAQDPSATTPADATASGDTALPATPTTSTPPEGSGATAPGITLTTAPPIVPRGSTKANIACRQMFPVVNDAIRSWNTANNGNNRARLTAASDALKKAGDTIPGMAEESEDSQLVTLTKAVSDQLKKINSDYANDRDVAGGPLEQAATSLWSYCENTH